MRYEIMLLQAQVSWLTTSRIDRTGGFWRISGDILGRQAASEGIIIRIFWFQENCPRLA